jgi:GNAT superfamily N-acetyltransferase
MNVAIPGLDVRVRPLVAHTDEAVDVVFAGMSAHSRYLRFHSPMPRLPGAARRALLAVDHRTHVALVADLPTRLGPHPVGIARFVDRGADRVDLAVAVADVYQGLGVGRRLLEALGAAARALGHRELHGDALRENVRVLRLLRSVFPGTRLRWADGTVRVSCPLDPSDFPITDEDVLGDLLW